MNVLAQEDTGFRAGLESNLEEFATLLPKIGFFLLILVIGIVLAKIISKIVTKVLQRVGFDQLVERGGVKKAMAKSKYDASGILGKIVYYLIFLLVLSAAFGVFGQDNPVSRFLSEIVAFLPSLFVAVLAIVIAAAIAAAVKELLTSMIGGLSFGPLLANAASAFIIAVGVFFALSELGVAPFIVNGIFYALLALVIVPLIIAFGVGGIEPAREAIGNLQRNAQDKADQVQAEVQSHDDDEAPAAPVRRTRATATAPVARTTTTRRRRPQA